MCSFQTLFHDSNSGYVVRCSTCKNIQVGYGNLALTFTCRDFTNFFHWLRKIKEQQDSLINESLRCIVIPTPCEGMKLLMSLHELTELVNMLETADTELQSLDLIKLFNSH